MAVRVLSLLIFEVFVKSFWPLSRGVSISLDSSCVCVFFFETGCLLSVAVGWMPV